MRMPSVLAPFVVGAACVISLAACAGSPSAAPPRALFPGPLDARSAPLAVGDLQGPVLIAVDADTGGLEAWPMQAHGGTSPHAISQPLGLAGSGGIAADGALFAITNDYAPEVVLYNASTKTKRTLGDPFGTPIDIAIDRHRNLYAVDVSKPPANVVMYPAATRKPRELVCALISQGEAIAADDQGDLFINGYGTKVSAGVFEIPAGPNGPEPDRCRLLPLKSEPGYVAGVTVDPKTDDLVVLDDPDDCAGGVEGRMTVYPRPYRAATGRSVDLGANCAGGIRLSADSSRVFVGDADVSGSFTFVLQRSFPDGRDMGSYQNGQPAGFAVYPNVLPN